MENGQKKPSASHGASVTLMKETRADRVLEDCHSYHPQPHRGYDHLSYAAIALTTKYVSILHPHAPGAVNMWARM